MGLDLEKVYDLLDFNLIVNWVIKFVNVLICILFDKILVPAFVKMKEQSEPLVEYISNKTTWFVPFAVITWYGPSGVLMVLQCICTLILILVRIKKLLFN